MPIAPPKDKKNLKKLDQTLPVHLPLKLDGAFQTHNQSTFYDKSSMNRRTFGADEQRKMRYVIETSSPKLMTKEKRWKDLHKQLVEQTKLDKRDPLYLKEMLR